jgi:hypothetical protein
MCIGDDPAFSRKFYGKVYYTTHGAHFTGMGAAITGSTNILTATPYMSGTFTGAEGVYYIDDYMVGSMS